MAAMKSLLMLLIGSTLMLTGVLGAYELGDSCYYDDECDKLTTFCRQRTVCACKENFREDNNECVATVGARCTLLSECSSLAYSSCLENICTCREGYVIESNKYRCLPMVYYLNGECVEDKQCQGGIGERSTCKEYECTCESGYHYVSSACRKSVGLGQTCDSDDDCAYNQDERNRLYCDKECKCKSGYKKEGNVCIDGAAQIAASLSLVFIYWIIKFSTSLV